MLKLNLNNLHSLNLRKFCRRLHLWLGLSLGLLLLVIFLSGAALVFYIEIDEYLHPEIQSTHISTAHTTQTKNWISALNTLRHTFPENKGPWRFEVSDKTLNIPARYYNPPESKNRISFSPMMVWLSPDGKEILRKELWGDYLTTWLYNLHFQLLSGDIGMIVVGITGLGLILILILGIVAWWPKFGQWSKALAFKKRSSTIGLLYDWHKTLGLISVLPLLLITITGVMMAFPQQSNTLLSWAFDEVKKPSKTPQTLLNNVKYTERQTNTERDTISELITQARKSLKRSKLAWIETPPVNGSIYRFRFQVEDDPSIRFPHTYIEVDSHNNHVMSVFDGTNKGTSNTINNWLHSLHDGSFGGLPIKLMWLLIGILSFILSLLGVMRWYYRKNKRQ